MSTYQCGVCTAVPSGFGWMEPPPRISILFGASKKSLPNNRQRKRFCSMVCQSVFSNAFHGGFAVNQEQLDNQAKRDALVALGDYATKIGIHKSLNDYSKKQAQGIVQCVLNAYQQSLKNHFPKEK